MRIKSGVWYWLAMACFVVGLLYGIGVEGTAQTLGHRLGRRVHHGHGADPAGDLLHAAGLCRRST